MFSWLFKKRGLATGTASPAASSSAATPTQASAARRSEKDAAAQIAARQATQAQAKAAQAAAREAENWPGRLAQALGNDAALLALAGSAPGLDIKLAAVEALASEDALRQAERAFRARDRKVHRLAKGRLGAAVARRTAHATADQLMQRGLALLQDPQLPLNYLAALDRDWQALPAALLDPAQHDAFTALRAQLDSTVRARADAEQKLQRWTAQAQRSLPTWKAAVAAASGQPLEEARAALAAVRSQAQAVLEAQPADASTAALGAALAQLLGDADAAQCRVDAPPPAAPPVVQQPAQDDTTPPTQRTHPARDRMASTEQCQQLEALLAQASAALANGELAALQQHLQASDQWMAESGTQWPMALRHRKQALRAEQARLKGWQSWGGERAREDLIADAEALARLVQAQGAEAGEPMTVDAQAPRPKLKLRDHAEAIRALRMRWKALDKLGEAAHVDLWQRFDSALTTAYQPVAAQNAAQQAARQQNLLARQALLDSLEALALPASDPAMPETASTDGPADWRELARQLDAFQVAWRQLGPMEHTAPADARGPLQQRLQALLERTEQPLRRARDRAAAERERLVQRAQALADGRAWPGGELQRELRALQAEWQEHARGLPLPRGVETALWTRFRAATDAVFAQRDAAAAARNAEQAAEVAEREALIQRLQALDAHTPVAQIDNTLGEVDRAWHQAPALLPRAAGQALETRYRDARAAATGLAATAVRLRWQAQVDAWRATLQAANGVDGADGADGVNPAADPAAQPDAQRMDDLLLQLEMALDLPAAPEQQAARQQLKLRALKEAMEGRTPAPKGRAPEARRLATLLGEPALDDLQRQRLLAVLTALRDAEPGTLGLPVPMA
jgi:DNA repair protein SbcC/Rad50